jgi:DNA-directed RNA polymerase specialized sigma54-like protein
MLKQNLSQKLQQKLSPQQLMFVKLLELNTLSFEQRLEDEMIENPALEAGKDDDEIIPEFAEDNFEGMTMMVKRKKLPLQTLMIQKSRSWTSLWKQVICLSTTMMIPEILD